MALISRLGVVLGLDAGEFNANLGKAQERLQGFNQQILGSRLGVAAIGAAFVSAAVSAVRFADSINDISQATELSVKEVLRLNEALTVNGGNSETAGRFITEFSKKVYEANQGNTDLRESFKKLGISMQELGHAKMDTLLEKSIDGFKRLGDSATKTGVAFEIFGKSARGLDLGGVSDQLSKNKNAYDDAEKAFIKIGNAIDNLNKISFTAKVGFAKNLGEAFEYITDKAIDFYNTMAQINIYLESKLGKYKNLIPGVIYMPNSLITKRPDGVNANDNTAIEREQKLSKEAENLLKKQAEYYQKELMISEAKRQRNQKEAELVFMSENERKLQLDLFDIEKKRQQLVLENKMNKFQAAEWAASEQKRAREEYDIAQSQRTFEFGWKKAYASYVESATNAAKMGEQAFVSVTNNMEQALDKFVATGKLSFSDLARSIIADLIKIQMRAQMTSIFGYLSNMLGLGGGGSGMFTGSTGEIGGAIHIGHALGGVPTMGVPSLVGENGPELFVPNQSGTIIPNNQLSSSLSGSGQIVYNGPYIANMSAIDTQSATQFLAKNKQAVWGANQAAQRSLPQSR